MDEVDLHLIRLLARDGRMTSAALGAEVGLSGSACHRRVQALEADGTIAGYAAVISDEAFGRVSIIFVAVTLEDQRRETLAAFERAVARAPEVEDLPF